MAQVLITDTKLDSLAQRIAAKSSAALPLTIDQMISIADSMTTGSGTINLQNKTVSPTTDTQTVVADISYDGLSSVVVNPIQTMTSSITANGNYIPSAGKYFSSISVNVPVGTTINNQDKIVTPTENQQIIEHDLGYTGLGIITVNAIANDYIGSSITHNTSSNVVIDGREITVRSGYYSTSVTKQVTAGLVNVPNQSATISPSLSVSNSGLISTYLNTGVPINIGVAEGYITSGSVVGGSMTVSGSNSLQLTTQGTTTFTPTTINQTIASGTYLTGVQTIKGDSNLVAGNIKSGISIFGVTGSYNGPGINVETITITPSESIQTATPSTGKDGFSQVTVNAISSSYIGSNIANRTSSDVNISGANITVASGYYSSAVNKNVSAGSATTPATAITANPTITISTSGLITASVTSSKSITPTISTGYISAGTAGTVSVTGSKTQQLTTKGATTFTPTTTNQTIASGTYLTGVQTIKGDSNLIADNIKSGISIFGVTGSYSGPGISLTSATITPSESIQTATPGTGYDGLSSVTINAIPDDYIGSAITIRSSSDVSISGASISIPAGYYNAAVSKSISTGSASTPATSITANPTITVSTAGLITASVTSSKSIIPTVSTGYVSAGTAGTVSITGSKTQQLSVKAAATYIPTTSNQTISSGVYLTGVQTINGDANLVADNIKSGISIFGVTGTYSGEGVNLQTTAITATETAQTINPDSGYDGFSQVTVSAISSSYIGSNITRRSSSDLTANGATITAPAGYYSTAASKSVSTATQATPTISVSTAGVITASATQTAGYVSAGTKSTSTTLSTQTATTITPTTSTQTAVASGTYTLGDVKVGPIPNEYLIPTGTITINSNGTNIDVAAYSKATVSVSPSLTTKTITPSESVQTATPGTGYDGLSSVTVNAISSSYIGSNIPTRTSSNVSISGNSITVASGYYSTAVTKTVSTATQATPSISVSTAGVITATATQTAGYVNAGTKTSSLSLTTVASATITPTSATQTAVAANRYTLGAITVAGDPDLLPENILSGVSIFGVSGTVNVVTYYSSSTVPSNSLGSNGDLYFQTSGV